MKFLLVLILALGSALSAAADKGVLAELPRHIELNERQHVSGQPSAETIAKLPSAGISVVIDLRPDSETPGLDKKSAVQSADMTYHALPIASPADLTPENVARFDSLLKETGDQGVLMHCASGNRVGAMLALRARWIEGKSADEALAIGKAAGLTSLAAAVEEKLQQAATPR